MAASLPRSSATYSSSRLTVGSSPKTSSPSSASAIAPRIPCVGRVTVSLRRSIKRSSSPASFLQRLEHPRRRTEMDLRHLRQALLPPLLDYPPGSPEHVRRTPGQLKPHLLRERLHLFKVPCPRQNRGRRDRHVILRPRPYRELHPRGQSWLNVRAGRLRELVHDEKLDFSFELLEYLHINFS